MAARRLVSALVALGVASALLATGRASAEPSIWERARRPSAAAEARLLSALERTLDARSLTQAEPVIARDLARAAVAMSDLSGVHDPVDPRLRCVLADALLAADVGREAQAAELVRVAVAELPDGPLLAEAYRLLGLALSLLDDAPGARDAHTRGLRLEVDPDARATSYYNRAESSLRLGELVPARKDYERALDLANDPEIVALARYGLALALERAGNLPTAFDALDGAERIRLPTPPYATPDPLELPGVFFVPPFERAYIEALRAMARARREPAAAARTSELEVAVAAWDRYLEAAPVAGPWVENARAHRASCLAAIHARPRERAR